MSGQSFSPTPFPFVNEILAELLDGLQSVLGDGLVGFYLGGSLAAGDFSSNRSDIDFLAVTSGELSTEQVLALKELHRRLSGKETKWGHELEGSYVPSPALRRYDPANATFPVIERGEELRVEHHEVDYLIKLAVLREQGITLRGAEIKTLLDPISPDDLRRAVLGIIEVWWQPMLSKPVKLSHPGYQDYAVLTMCRMLYTLQNGGVATKPQAARWALATLDGRWHSLIEQADAWENDQPFDHLAETRDFMRFTIEQCQAWDYLR